MLQKLLTDKTTGKSITFFHGPEVGKKFPTVIEADDPKGDSPFFNRLNSYKYFSKPIYGFVELNFDLGKYEV